MSRRGLVLFIAMCVIWGIPYLLIKVSLRGLGPVDLVFVRVLLGAVLLVPIALTRVQVRPLLKRWGWILAYTVIEMGIPWVLLSDAELRISSSLSGLLVSTVPLIGVVIGLRDPKWRAPWVATGPRPLHRARGRWRARGV